MPSLLKDAKCPPERPLSDMGILSVRTPDPARGAVQDKAPSGRRFNDGALSAAEVRHSKGHIDPFNVLMYICQTIFTYFLERMADAKNQEGHLKRL